MKNKLNLLVALSALLSAMAFAGATNPLGVTVDLDERQAEGDMWAARSAKNDVELIGCGVNYFDDGLGGVFVFGFCQAQDANEVYAVCFTQNPSLIEAIHSITDFSFIRFNWDENDDCTRIGNSTQSLYLPHFTTRGGLEDD